MTVVIIAYSSTLPWTAGLYFFESAIVIRSTDHRMICWP